MSPLKPRLKPHVSTDNNVNKKLNNMDIIAAYEYVKEVLYGTLGITTQLKKICDFFEQYSETKDGVVAILKSNNNAFQNKLADYLDILGLYRIRANSYSLERCDSELHFLKSQFTIAKALSKKLTRGTVYTKTEVKRIMQEVYDDICPDRYARASDLYLYIKYKEVRVKGKRCIKIL